MRPVRVASCPWRTWFWLISKVGARMMPETVPTLVWGGGERQRGRAARC